MKPKILILDDEPIITRSLVTLLKFALKGDIYSSNDPVQAVEMAKEIMPNLVISDFMMPKMNGLEFLKCIKEYCPATVTILLTGYSDKENAIKCINEVGLYYYAEKPWDNNDLVNIIKNGLKMYNLESEIKKRVLELEESNNKITRLYGLLKKDFDQEVDSLQNLLITLANLIESKDTYTDGHTRRVGAISRAVGRRLNLDEKVLNTLELSGIIHDIGKVGVSEEILNKEGKLAEVEFEEMKKHTILGYHICLPLNILKDCLDPIRHHHEKLDGSGYPDGLKGDEISLEARILAVADIFDAIHSNRPYRKCLRIEMVKKILFDEAQRGLLDKNIVTILIELIDEGVLEGIISE